MAILFRLPGEFRVVLRNPSSIRVNFNIPFLYGSDLVQGRAVFWDFLPQNLEFLDNTNFTRWYSLNEEVLGGRAIVEDGKRSDVALEVKVFSNLEISLVLGN